MAFADDVLLVVAGATDLESMLDDWAKHAGRVVLQLHHGSTNAVCNRINWHRCMLEARAALSAGGTVAKYL